MKKLFLLLAIALPLAACFAAKARGEGFDSVSYKMDKSDVIKKMGAPSSVTACFQKAQCGFAIKDIDPSLSPNPPPHWLAEIYVYNSFNPFHYETQQIGFDRKGKVVAKTHYFPDLTP